MEVLERFALAHEAQGWQRRLTWGRTTLWPEPCPGPVHAEGETSILALSYYYPGSDKAYIERDCCSATEQYKGQLAYGHAMLHPPYIVFA